MRSRGHYAQPAFASGANTRGVIVYRGRNAQHQQLPGPERAADCHFLGHNAQPFFGEGPQRAEIVVLVAPDGLCRPLLQKGRDLLALGAIARLDVANVSKMANVADVTDVTDVTDKGAGASRLVVDSVAAARPSRGVGGRMPRCSPTGRGSR